MTLTKILIIEKKRKVLFMEKISQGKRNYRRKYRFSTKIGYEEYSIPKKVIVKEIGLANQVIILS